MKKYIRKTFRRKFTKSGEVYIDSIVKIIICVVVGALMLGALVSVADGALQTAQNKVDDMFGSANIGTSNSDEPSETSTPEESIPEEPQTPEAPIVLAQPQSAEYDENDDAVGLSITASAPDGGILSYQWQLLLDGVSWDDITDATLSTYKPDTTTVSVYKYRCRVTNTKGSQSTSVISEIATITVKEAVTGYTVTLHYNIENSYDFLIVSYKKDDGELVNIVDSDCGESFEGTIEIKNVASSITIKVDNIYTIKYARYKIDNGNWTDMQGPFYAPKINIATDTEIYIDVWASD